MQTPFLTYAIAGRDPVLRRGILVVTISLSHFSTRVNARRIQGNFNPSKTTITTNVVNDVEFPPPPVFVNFQKQIHGKQFTLQHVRQAHTTAS